MIYFKNKRTNELDEYLGDIHNDIVDMEAYITRQLEQRILEQADLLIKISNIAAELDWYSSSNCKANLT
jgi:DNA mismatch repair ATPase MutS